MTDRSDANRTGRVINKPKIPMYYRCLKRTSEDDGGVMFGFEILSSLQIFVYSKRIEVGSFHAFFFNFVRLRAEDRVPQTPV